MHPFLTTLFVIALGAAMSGPAHAADLEVLPSRICQEPAYEMFADGGRRRADSTAVSPSAAAQWESALQAVMARCQKGDVLELTHEAQRNATRFCDLNKPVHFLSPRGVICTYAGGVREVR